ncbi:hypothetical protein SEA_VINCENZO_94 [Mycobacterium phage Vincenzo]|uniref:Uncharacterized protein n=2 Tax=Coopervirus vincenzo TaxID=1983110 RepID=A0A0F6WE19_9CAUD|nr:hypothetical protein SEA_VINCENZO_94 [Mycobacterium phage Vincenzo]AKF14356.1 hypothetical protein SEA_VINCENZO_94 [Mycobacterium phage Vincenzo]AKF14760.1 hypothetical protein SEA_ALANGRANT_95 [Mycobacterium phage AlanGrant]
MMHAIYCPACGWFGRKAAGRNRRAADTAHVRWAAQLARETRAERRDKVFRETDGGLFAAMVDSPTPLTLDQVLATLPCRVCGDPGWHGWCCDVCDPNADHPRLDADGKIVPLGDTAIGIEASWPAPDPTGTPTPAQMETWFRP